MQVVFGVNIVALVDGQPKTLNLSELLECFLKHRQEIVTRHHCLNSESSEDPDFGGYGCCLGEH